MVELVDEIIDKMERRLAISRIELTAQELDELRDTLDSVLIKYEEHVHGIS